MIKTGLIPVLVTIAFLVWVPEGWSVDESAAPSTQSESQSSPGSGCKMMGGGMGQGKAGMMQGGKHKGMHGMMQGKKHDGMGMHDGMGRQEMAGAHEMHGMRDLMGHFHGWMHRLMANRQAVGLTPEQLDQIDLAMAEHRKFALRSQAEAAVLRIDLKRGLRQKSPDLKSLETLVKGIGEQETKTEMEGIRLYASVLNMLTPEQRAKVDDLVGTPFPRPWEKGVKPEAAEGDQGEEKAASSDSPPAGKLQSSGSGGGKGSHAH
jgi:hypothetical protein